MVPSDKQNGLFQFFEFVYRSGFHSRILNHNISSANNQLPFSCFSDLKIFLLNSGGHLRMYVFVNDSGPRGLVIFYTF